MCLVSNGLSEVGWRVEPRVVDTFLSGSPRFLDGDSVTFTQSPR